MERVRGRAGDGLPAGDALTRGADRPDARSRERRTPAERLVGGVLAGAIGTAVLELVERAEARWLGRQPVYAARVIARRLGKRRAFRLPRALSSGAGLRWPYGVALGAAFSSAGAFEAPGTVLATGLRVGLTIWAAELAVLPHLGATPPLRRWTPAELALLAVHTCAFGLAATAAARAAVFSTDPVHSPTMAR